jgi:heparan-alpha-glucosaminide N-acetyltransferase
MDASPSPQVSQRLVSLDTYRGLVMFLMVAEVLHLSRVAGFFPDSTFWWFLSFNQSHVEWVGCSIHDLIQPSFSFMVGVALPFSIASRIRRGQSRSFMTLHAFWRAVVLIFLGIFLRSLHHSQTYYTFEDTLTQIGLGYFPLFLLGFYSVRVQWIALGVILFGYWLAFALYPLPPANFDYTSVGVPNNWEHLATGFAAHWNKNVNFASAFDQWFLNLFPREKPFIYNGGGYLTLSFIPTLGTMILGLLAGNVLRSERVPMGKFQWLCVAGIVSIIAGLLLHFLGLCPIVKRIWTPSWTLFSGGWCFLILASLYFLIDMKEFKRWTFPLVVIGMNSITIYCMSWLMEGFVLDSLRIHLGHDAFSIFGEPYETLVSGTAIILVFWLILFWMYRKQIFIRI